MDSNLNNYWLDSVYHLASVGPSARLSFAAWLDFVKDFDLISPDLSYGVLSDVFLYSLQENEPDNVNLMDLTISYEDFLVST